jgi:hypothetical protein
VNFSVFRDVKNEIKWAYQRVFRGWDDRVIWSIDWYLAEYLPVWLEELKNSKHGCPMIMVPEGDDSTEYTDDDWNIVKENWNKTIDIMIDGFRAAKEIMDGEFPSWDIYHNEYEKRYGEWDMHDHEKGHKLMEELNTWDGIKKEEAAIMVRYNEGMDLFKKYFFNLWT